MKAGRKPSKVSEERRVEERVVGSNEADTLPGSIPGADTKLGAVSWARAQRYVSRELYLWDGRTPGHVELEDHSQYKRDWQVLHG